MIKRLCFNCGETISSERLEKSLPCEKDINEEDIKLINSDEDIYKILLNKGRLFNFKKIFELDNESKKFCEFFNKIVNSEPWSIQISWFKRLYNKRSFSMIAPTGTGKSTFILVASLYFANKGYKILIILPTRVLVTQMLERLNNYLEKSNLELKILAYTGNKKEKEEIKNGNFQILIVSNQFISKNFDILSDKKFDIIFVDDVDAFFKGSKNIERVIRLLGFSDDEIKFVNQIIDLKIKRKLETLSEMREKLNEIKSKDHGCLVLSSATGTIRGKRVRLYKELLDFSIGSASSKLRNVVDCYISGFTDFKPIVLDLVKKMEDGVLIFVCKDLGSNYAEELYKFLLENGFKVGLVISKEKESLKNIRRFANGEINILIGMAHYQGLLVRGLDLPTRVKYAIFVGIPKISINISKFEKNLKNLLILAEIIKPLIEESKKIDRLLKNLNRKLRRLSSDALISLAKAYAGTKDKEEWMEYYLNIIREIEEIVVKYINDKDFLDKLKEHPDLSIKIIENNIYLNILDIKTYIQASGRTSRLYAGGLTKGLSIILSDDEKLLNALDKKLKLYFYS
ncbi:MAG: reverse gyrase [Candidatus Aenigmatarchaeota archaeon]